MTTAVLVGLAPAVALGVAALWARRRFVMVTVRGRSMEPTLRDGQRVLVRRLRAGRVRAGQIVVAVRPPPWLTVDSWQGGRLRPETGFRPDGSRRPEDGWLIKRVAAVAGETLPDELAGRTAYLGVQVPPGHVVLLGDNPAHSFDSRRCGYFTEAGLLGVVVVRPSG